MQGDPFGRCDVNKLFLALAAMALAFACCPCSSLELPVGSPVDDGDGSDEGFTLESLNGGTVSLSDLQGHVVVLDFWATWCSPCRESMPHLQAIHDRYAGDGVVVLAINIEENRRTVEEYIAEAGYTFTVLLDPNGETADAYSVWAIPHTIIIDRQGQQHEVLEGPQGVERELEQWLP